MPRVEGVKAVMRAIEQRALSKVIKEGAGISGEPSVIVGYTANYALYVHENIEMKGAGKPRANGKGNYWDPQGRAQAKFLEAPARQLRNELGSIVRTALKRGKSLLQALYLAGLRLQRASMLIVPVDTGNLKASAFTMKEE